MTAKPICVVYLGNDPNGERPNITWSQCNSIARDFEQNKSDYHWFFIPRSNSEEIEFKVFYEKDFTPIQYEELKEIIQKAIENEKSKS